MKAKDILNRYRAATEKIDKDYWEGAIEGLERNILLDRATENAAEAAEQAAEDNLAKCIRDLATA